MNIGLIGSGGREHALCHALKKSSIIKEIFCIPGNAGTDSIAKNFEIKLAYEALAWGTHVNGYRHAMQLIHDADHENLGIALDAFHILSKQDNISQIRHIPKNKIFVVDYKNTLRCYNINNCLLYTSPSPRDRG